MLKFVQVIVLILFANIVFAKQTIDDLPKNAEVMASFEVNRPTGIVVTEDNRIFVNFPYASYSDHRHRESVVEILSQGNTRRLLNDAYNEKKGDAGSRMVNIQSITLDSEGDLWLLDTGSPQRKGVIKNGAKLIKVDVKSDTVVQTILLSAELVNGSDYLNDLRISTKYDLAVVTDSSKGGLVIVDLNGGNQRRVFVEAEFINSHEKVLPIVEFMPLGNADGSIRSSATDGIGLSPDQEIVYVTYRPLAGIRSVLQMPTSVLANFSLSNEEVVGQVTGMAVAVLTDGIKVNAQGEILFTDIERNAVTVLRDGVVEVLATFAALSWPDAIDLNEKGDLFVTAPQFHRLAVFNDGVDQSQPPFNVFRIREENNQ